MTNYYISQEPGDRKRMPMASGLLDYFPAALAAVAEHSHASNEKHNPGQDLHWSRQNSSDHADCIVRHLVERGGYDDEGRRHSAALAWRALALLQEELEKEGAAPGRASRFPLDVRVVADEPKDDADTANLVEGLVNYWRYDVVPQFELTPKGEAFIKGEKYGEAWAGLVAAKRGAEAKRAKAKKLAVPKPVRKRK